MQLQEKAASPWTGNITTCEAAPITAHVVGRALRSIRYTFSHH